MYWKKTRQVKLELMILRFQRLINSIKVTWMSFSKQISYLFNFFLFCRIGTKFIAMVLLHLKYFPFLFNKTFYLKKSHQWTNIKLIFHSDQAVFYVAQNRRNVLFNFKATPKVCCEGFYVRSEIVIFIRVNSISLSQEFNVWSYIILIRCFYF